MFEIGNPITLEVTYDSPSLFVGMTVFNWSTGSPVQVGSLIPMTNYISNTYGGLFTPATAGPYTVFKAVYTDDTYTTIDTDYAESSYSFRAEDVAGLVWNAILADYEEPNSTGAQLASVQTGVSIGINSVVAQLVEGGTIGSPNVLTIYIGDDVINQPLQILKNGQPVDLTTVEDIEMDFLLDPSQQPPTYYTAKKSTDQITFIGVNPVLGQFVLSMAGTNTAKFAAQTLVNQDVIVTDSSGKLQTYRAPNGLSVLTRNTP